MAQKGEVRYRLTADNKEFKKAFTEAKSQAQDFGKSLASHLGPAGDIMSAIGTKGLVAAAGLGAIAAGAGTAAAALGKAMDHADKIANLQAQTGLAAESLQRLGAVAMLSNSSTEALAGSINTMQKNLVEAPEGFNRLGLSAKRLIELRPESAFMEVAKAIKAIQNPTEQTAAAMLYFGRSGGEMLRVINADIAGVSKRAEDLGLVLSGDTVAALSSLKSEFDLTKAAAGGVITNLGAVIGTSPGVKEAVTAIGTAFGELTKRLLDHKEDIQGFVSDLASLAKAAAKLIEMGPDLAKWTPAYWLARAAGKGGSMLKSGVQDIASGISGGWDWLKKGAMFGAYAPVAGAYSPGPAAPKPGGQEPARHFVGAAELEAQKKALEALKDAMVGFFNELAKRRTARETFDLLGESVDDLNFKLGMLASQLDRFAKGQGLDNLSNSGIGKALEDLRRLESSGGSNALTTGWKEMLTTLQTTRAETAGTEEQIKELGIAVLPVNRNFDATFGKVLSVKRELGNTKKATYDWGAALQNIANMVSAMGGKGGLFGSILGGVSGIGATLQSFTKTGKGSLGEGLKGLGASFKGGFSGILSGLGGVFSLASAGFGIGKAIVGLFKSDPVKNAQKEIGKALGYGISRDLAQSLMDEAKKTGKSLTQVAKEYQAQIVAGQQAQNLATLTEGVGIAQEGANKLLDLMDQLSPAAQAAGAALVKAVQDAMIANGLGYLATGALREDKSFQAVQGAVGATSQLISGMQTAGGIDTAILQNAGAMAVALKDQATAAAIAANMPQTEAVKVGLATIAPVLKAQLDASLASGRALDQNTKDLIEEAKKNGIDIVADPLLQQLQVSKESRDLLRTIAGGGGGNGGGGGGNNGPPDNNENFAHGGIVVPAHRRAAHGTMASGYTKTVMGETGRLELAAPVDAMVRSMTEVAMARAGRGGSGWSGPTTVILQLDGRVLAQGMVRRNRAGGLPIAPSSVVQR